METSACSRKSDEEVEGGPDHGDRDHSQVEEVHVGTSVISATHSWFGPLAWKRWQTRGRRLALVATDGHFEASALADAVDSGFS